MLIEVTEKEALEIYSQRYIKEHARKFWIWASVWFALALLCCFAATYFASAWTALVILCIPMAPVLYMFLKLSRVSGHYARSKLKEG